MNIFRNHTQALLLALLFASALTGCSSATAPTRFYLLSDPKQSGDSDAACGVRLAGTSVAPYLQRTHIMIQSGTNELVPAMQHRWSEPLEAGVSRLLARCLNGGGQSVSSVRVQIDHLHGNTNGDVVLQARWALKGQGPKNLMAATEQQFSASLPQPEAGYDELVSTQRALVLELCAEIKAAAPSC